MPANGNITEMYILLLTEVSVNATENTEKQEHWDPVTAAGFSDHYKNVT